jgi:hypothetical protein
MQIHKLFISLDVIHKWLNESFGGKTVKPIHKLIEDNREEILVIIS